MGFTIKDVARLAGVSTSTVSRVLHESPLVLPATRQRVLEAIRRLDYRPDALARGLITGQSMAVGVIVPNLRNPAMVENIHGAENAAREMGYHLILTSTFEAPEREAVCYQELMEMRVDGIVLCIRRPSPELQGLVAAGPPTVCVSSRLTGRQVGLVFVDARAAAREVARHLVSLGYRRIAFLAGPVGFAHAQRMQEGLAYGLAEAGLELAPDMVVLAGAQMKSGYEAAKELLSRCPLPDAVFAYNDLLAAGTLLACRGLGIRVPEDIGLVGCEDTFLAEVVEPPLTSIHMPLAQMGDAAMRLLFALMRGEELECREVVLPCSLTIRESCGARLRRSLAAAGRAK